MLTEALDEALDAGGAPPPRAGNSAVSSTAGSALCDGGRPCCRGCRGPPRPPWNASEEPLALGYVPDCRGGPLPGGGPPRPPAITPLGMPRPRPRDPTLAVPPRALLSGW